ncbi:MAG: hypothetical protein HY681_14695 [Chloroflexi bacterium]|nr:hypothetical protein [Chloroflexota bacterium]
MPKYIDYHAKLPAMPPQVAQQLASDMKAGKPNQFGVKPINFLMGKDGSGYCLCEAPGPDAVVKTHAAMGITMTGQDIKEVTTLV